MVSIWKEQLLFFKDFPTSDDIVILFKAEYEVWGTVMKLNEKTCISCEKADTFFNQVNAKWLLVCDLPFSDYYGTTFF